MKESWTRLGIGALYVAVLSALLTPEAQQVLGQNWGLAFAPAILGGLAAWINLTRV